MALIDNIIYHSCNDKVEYVGGVNFIGSYKPLSYECRMFDGLTIQTVEPPNAIQRFFQRILLGFKWRKL